MTTNDIAAARPPLTILSLRASNIKRLQAVRIEPGKDGGLVVISGRNAQGKSSVLDAIAMAFGGAKLCPTEPIRRGENVGEVEADLGELRVRRTFIRGGATQLIVTGKDGAKYASPQGLLDSLLGSLSFDPLAFLRMDKHEQGELLRRMLGLDFKDRDGERTLRFVQRTEVNREVKRLEGVLSGMPDKPGVPDDPVDVMVLAGELERLSNEERRQAERRELIANRKREAELLRSEIEELERRHAEKRAALARCEAERATMQAAADVSTPVDKGPILERIRTAETTNADVRAKHRRREVAAQVAEAIGRAQQLTERIESIDDGKRAAIAAAPMPIAGLGFAEDGSVIFQRLPFEQASSAEQLRCSVAIGLALNPRLRVLLVREGSLLDDDSMRLLADIAEQRGAQVWVECVGKREQTSVVIEDGEVQVP